MPVENVTIPMYLGMVYGNNVRVVVKCLKGKGVLYRSIPWKRKVACMIL
jgi:hypothetical protein